MTVKELKTHLEKLPEDAVVVIDDKDELQISSVYYKTEIFKGKEYKIVYVSKFSN